MELLDTTDSRALLKVGSAAIEALDDFLRGLFVRRSTLVSAVVSRVPAFCHAVGVTSISSSCDADKKGEAQAENQLKNQMHFV